MKTITKARRKNAAAKRQTRTFAGYIGLSNGRPHVSVDVQGGRTIVVFTNERKAKEAYGDVALVTITGVWESKS